uniref:WHEP-TRS domain-containing protein n=1 Tax=Ditylenchus dipsaci TaxID=166011 RepID=A0A915D207_9BILA
MTSIIYRSWPQKKAPPPKIEIEGRSHADLKQIKESLISEESKQVRDEKTLEEIAELRKTKGAELTKMKKDFEQGTVVNDPDAAAAEAAARLNKFEKMDNTLEQNLEERLKSMEKIWKA